LIVFQRETGIKLPLIRVRKNFHILIVNGFATFVNPREEKQNKQILKEAQKKIRA